MLKVGSKAPDVRIKTTLGFEGNISELWADGPLVLYFYPKDNTPVCTKQACSLQSSVGEFGKLGVKVLGSSTGSLESKVAFAEKNVIRFPLVGDDKGELAKAYDAYRGILNIPKRISYVIKDGQIIGAVHSEMSVGSHLDMIKKTLKS